MNDRDFIRIAMSHHIVPDNRMLECFREIVEYSNGDTRQVQADPTQGADARPVAWALKIADGRLDMTDATDPPTDRHHDWAERHGHRYVALNAAQYAMLQEILK